MGKRRKELEVFLSMPCLKGRTRVPEFLRVSTVSSDHFWSYLLRSSSWEMWLQKTCPNPCEEVQEWNIAHWSMTESFLLLSSHPLSSVTNCFHLPTPSHQMALSHQALSKPSLPENRVCSLDFRLSLSVELSFWNPRLVDPGHSSRKEQLN